MNIAFLDIGHALWTCGRVNEHYGNKYLSVFRKRNTGRGVRRSTWEQGNFVLITKLVALDLAVHQITLHPWLNHHDRGAPPPS